jgi:myo-inositol-1(or 4)-monophosphatase
VKRPVNEFSLGLRHKKTLTMNTICRLSTFVVSSIRLVVVVCIIRISLSDVTEGTFFRHGTSTANTYSILRPQQRSITTFLHSTKLSSPSFFMSKICLNILRRRRKGTIAPTFFPTIQCIPTAQYATTTFKDSSQSQFIPLDHHDIRLLVTTAENAALAAGRIIQNHLGCSTQRRNKNEINDEEECLIKTSMKDIVTKYDREAQSVIERIIRETYPDHTFLGEEDVEPGAKASEEALLRKLQESSSNRNDFIWIFDPIDGTANFAAGLSLCAVTVGVVYRGIPLVGVINDPHANELFVGVKGQGATVKSYDRDGHFVSEESIRVADNVEQLKDAIINAGCPADPNAFQTSMRGVIALNTKARGIRMLACSALTTAWIAAGRLTAHFGYDLSSWDLMPGALIIQEAGGYVTDLDGSPYQLTTRNMLCSNGQQAIHSKILEVLNEADAVVYERSI